mgnify:CR=1 FL=1
MAHFINILMTNLYDVVMFHYPCQDGLTSAWITNYYHKSNNKIIELYPIKHGDPYDFSRLENKKLIICDYAPSLEILNELDLNYIYASVKSTFRLKVWLKIASDEHEAQ